MPPGAIDASAGAAAARLTPAAKTVAATAAPILRTILIAFSSSMTENRSHLDDLHRIHAPETQEGRGLVGELRGARRREDAAEIGAAEGAVHLDLPRPGGERARRKTHGGAPGPRDRDRGRGRE